MTPTTGADRAAALDAALEVLACPLCLAPLARDGRALVCAAGHAHDVARQGYASLAPGSTIRGDTARMVAARAAFLAEDHFAAITEAIAAAVPDEPGWCVDLAGGSGHHLAGVLGARPSLRGLGLDVSVPAARAAAGAHPRLASATTDLRHRLPVRDGSVRCVLGVFAPRNGPETARVLAPGGTAIVVTPLPAHLAELRGPFGTLAIGEDKERRVDDALAPLVRIGGGGDVVLRRSLTPDAAAAAVLMGPSAHHLAEEAVQATAAATGPIDVTIAVSVAVYTR